MTVMQDAAAVAQAYAIDKAHSEVAFQVRHLVTKCAAGSRTLPARFGSTSSTPRTRRFL